MSTIAAPVEVTYLPARDLGDGVTVSANLHWKYGGEHRIGGTLIAVRDPQVSRQEAESVARRLKAMGYFASPFPEGDGMTIEVPDPDLATVAADIRACSGWSVRVGTSA